MNESKKGSQKNITLEVQITSRRWMFIHVSQFTKWPL